MFLHYQVMEKLESDCHSSLSNLLMYLHNISKNVFPFFFTIHYLTKTVALAEVLEKYFP